MSTGNVICHVVGHVIWLRNPFQIDSREVYPVKPGSTVRDWLDSQGLVEFELPTVCILNGTPLLRADWPTHGFAQNDVAVFIALPLGGGGGGKNPLRTVLMIAVMVVANVYGGPLAGAMGFSGTFATAAASAAIAVAGSVLVNALVPLPTANLPNASASGVSPSPTYSLQAQGNYARLSQPIPVVYGRHLIYPDLAATPYAEYVSNEQYVYQLHVIGQGEYEIEAIRIEDTPLDSFIEIEAQVILPGGANTLFNHDVVTAPEVAGQELIAVGDLSDLGGVNGRILGPFTINPAQTQIAEIGLDLLMMRGLYYANDDGSLSAKTVNWRVEVRAIDALGDALSGWVVLAEPSHSAATGAALRLSFKYPVAPGRYEVRLQRLDSKDSSNRAGHELRWGEVRGYLANPSVPANLTLLALKMRATDNLSQRSSRMVNCLVTRKLSVWSAETGWSNPQPTRSIAWAFADAVRASYGAKLTDARLDLAALYRLDQTWEARGDTFDAVFDQSITVWEAMTRIARCGRAVPFLQGGVVRIVRDEQKTMPVALFSARNIVRGSLKIQYVMPGEDTADSVTVEYFNPKTWKPDEVTVTLPGSTSDKPAKVNLFGCTSEAQAIREGKYIAAANRYRRRLITLSTEMEGLIPTYGDLIAISHDMPSWGVSGDVLAWDGTTKTATLSEPLVWQAGVSHYLALRNADGSVAGPYRVNRGATDRHVVFEAAPDSTLQTGSSSERTHFAFGVGEAWSQLARVMGIRPRGAQVEITCVAENQAVHSADQG